MISVKVQDAIVENVVEEFDDREKKKFCGRMYLLLKMMNLKSVIVFSIKWITIQIREAFTVRNMEI